MFCVLDLSSYPVHCSQPQCLMLYIIDTIGQFVSLEFGSLVPVIPGIFVNFFESSPECEHFIFHLQIIKMI